MIHGNATPPRNASEPLLINPEYIDNLDERIKRYLGFGQPSGISIYPQTDLSTMPLRMQSEIFRQLISRLGKKVAGLPVELLRGRLSRR